MKRKAGSGLLALGFLILTFSVETAGAHKKHQESPASAEAPAPAEAPATSELIHFPIALLLAALIAEILFAATSQVRLPLRIFLAILALLIASTGFLGGSLLYGIDHLAWGV